MNAESRGIEELPWRHKSYQLATSFGDVLGIKRGRVRNYEGAVIDAQQTESSSTFDIIPREE